jgi:hypothetical protein
MLTVYTYKIPKPSGCFDLSMIPLDQWMDTVLDLVAHQTTGTLWLGYLDGWMLTPHEEVVLRKAIRKFQCIVVSQFPLSFSHAWKNEIDYVYTDPKYNGISNTHNNGCSLHNGSSSEYGCTGTHTSTHSIDNQGRKARSR